MPPGAEAQHGGGVGAGDGQGGVERVQDRLPVDVDAPAAVADVGVAPGDHEHLLAALHEVLHERAPGREIGDVVLVDHRWDDQQRPGAHRRCLRGVLDQLERLGAQHHRARGGGEVGTDLEGVGPDHRRHPGRGGQVGDQVAHALDDVGAAGVDQRLPRGGADEGVVARREGGDEVVEGELEAGAVAPVQVGVGEQRRRTVPPATR